MIVRPFKAWLVLVSTGMARTFPTLPTAMLLVAVMVTATQSQTRPDQLITESHAAAQRPPSESPELVVMSVIDVKPDVTAEFGALQADAMAAQRAGGQAWRETWHTATFGHPYRVVVLRPVAGLDHFDGQTYTAKGIGVAAAATINERARRNRGPADLSDAAAT